MTKPLTCPGAHACMERASDDTLNASEQTRLEAHLASCGSCRRVWDAQARLSRAARRWVMPAPEDDPGAAFNAQVLAQLRTLPARQPSPWLPLAAALALAAVLIWLPAAIRPDWGWLAASTRLLPGWLAANLSSLPAGASGLLTEGHGFDARAGWLWGVLGAAALMNGLFCVCAAQSRRRRALR